MTNDFEDYGVEYINSDECEKIGDLIGKALCRDESGRLPTATQMYSHARQNIKGAEGLELIVCADDQMRGAKAIAMPVRCEIRVGQTFLQEFHDDTDDARFTFLHELNHILFHRGTPYFYRMAQGNVIYPFMQSKETSSEWQADKIARSTSMPLSLVKRTRNSTELAKLAGMPRVQAIERFRELAPKTAKTIPLEIEAVVQSLKATNAATRIEGAHHDVQVRKNILWQRLPTIDGQDPREWRKCGIYQISWSEFGKPSQCGWYIDGSEIRSFFATSR